jgi:hypothetical protein
MVPVFRDKSTEEEPVESEEAEPVDAIVSSFVCVCQIFIFSYQLPVHSLNSKYITKHSSVVIY